MARRRRATLNGLLCAASLAACSNSPYPADAAAANTLYYTFDERSPRHLDPVASYSIAESAYTEQIYEAPYGYHYLKRPFTLVPRLATEIASPHYLDAQGRPLPDDAPAERIAQSVYEVHIKPGLRYQPHPAFARDAQGRPRYLALREADLAGKRSPWDFEHQGTREVLAADFVHALKRHATTRVEAPLFAVFAEHLIGLQAFGDTVRAADAALLAGRRADAPDKPFLDLRRWPLAGAEVVDAHTYRLRLNGKYPQWRYWMAMPFTAPIPWEAEAFYAQPGMAERGLSLDQWPVGTGPYMMARFERDRRHVLVRNPNFRHETYPCEGEAGDRAAGWLDDCGKPLPFVDTLYVTIEKEKVSRKEKFRQGYLDLPEIERPEWGVDFRNDAQASPAVDRLYRERGFQFPVTTDTSIWFLGFNMLDPVVGWGDTPARRERNRQLRQALSIAIDWEEGYGRIFRHKGGEAAHGPLPPGLFGSREGQGGFHDPVTHHVVDGRVQRRSIDEARALLAQAGYPGGRDAATGRPLVLNYDFQRAMTPEFRSETDWMVKQFAKLGVQLEIRATDFNQYQDKLLRGRHQVFFGGWLADYPDAENFLFLLYGPNAKRHHQGENIANYENPAFDAMFHELRTLDDGPRKQQLIDRMVALVQQDAPWSFGYFPWSGLAFQPWVHNGKPGTLVRDTAKYYRVDTAQRVRLQAQWNRPVYGPLLALLLAAVLLAGAAWRLHRRREHATALEAA